MSDCSDLIGLRYRLGADGGDGEIDCIHLVYVALGRMGIQTPPFRSSWYDNNWREISRDLLKWGRRIDSPSYDGDVLLLMQDTPVFAVTWRSGILYICEMTKKVSWCLPEAVGVCHCFRSRGS